MLYNRWEVIWKRVTGPAHVKHCKALQPPLRLSGALTWEHQHYTEGVHSFILLVVLPAFTKVITHHSSGVHAAVLAMVPPVRGLESWC